jgi:hypothetical protein
MRLWDWFAFCEAGLFGPAVQPGRLGTKCCSRGYCDHIDVDKMASRVSKMAKDQMAKSKP